MVRKKKTDTPQAAQTEERPAAADPTHDEGVQALTAPTTRGASGAAAGGPEPVAGETPPAGAPTLELTPENIAQVINTLAKNDQVFLDEIKRLREEVSSMRGGYSQKRIDPNYDPRAPAQGQPQETPELIKQLAPLAMAAVAKFLGPAEEAKEESFLEKKWKEYMQRKQGEFADNIIRAMEASEKGQLWIGQQPPQENNKRLEAPK